MKSFSVKSLVKNISVTLWTATLLLNRITPVRSRKFSSISRASWDGFVAAAHSKGATMAKQLYVRETDGTYRLASVREVMEASMTQSRKLFNRGREFSSVAETRRFFKIQLSNLAEECFSAAFLDNRHRLLKFERLFYGTIDGCSVHPRVVVRRALELNSAAIILAHNHPSGIVDPSSADCQITARLRMLWN